MAASGPPGGSRQTRRHPSFAACPRLERQRVRNGCAGARTAGILAPGRLRSGSCLVWNSWPAIVPRPHWPIRAATAWRSSGGATWRVRPGMLALGGRGAALEPRRRLDQFHQVLRGRTAKWLAFPGGLFPAPPGSCQEAREARAAPGRPPKEGSRRDPKRRLGACCGLGSPSPNASGDLARTWPQNGPGAGREIGR